MIASVMPMPTVQEVFDLENGIIHGPCGSGELTRLELRWAGVVDVPVELADSRDSDLIVKTWADK